MRTLPRDHPTLESGRLGRVWLLRLPLALFQGHPSASGCHPGRLPIAFALTSAKADERQTLLGMLEAAHDLVAHRARQTLIAD